MFEFLGCNVRPLLAILTRLYTTTRRENAFVFEMLSCYIVIVLLLLPACLHYRSALQCHIFAGCVIFIVKEHWESILWYVYDYDSQSAHHKVGRFKVFHTYIFSQVNETFQRVESRNLSSMHSTCQSIHIVQITAYSNQSLTGTT